MLFLYHQQHLPTTTGGTAELYEVVGCDDTTATNSDGDGALLMMMILPDNGSVDAVPCASLLPLHHIFVLTTLLYRPTDRLNGGMEPSCVSVAHYCVTK